MCKVFWRRAKQILKENHGKLQIYELPVKNCSYLKHFKVICNIAKLLIMVVLCECVTVLHNLVRTTISLMLGLEFSGSACFVGVF